MWVVLRKSWMFRDHVGSRVPCWPFELEVDVCSPRFSRYNVNPGLINHGLLIRGVLPK